MQKKINKDSIIEEICKNVKSKEIIIYGAGHYGKVIQKYFQTEYDTEIKCFVVSSIEDGVLDSGEHERIRCIEEFKSDNSKYQLIIAVAEQKQECMLKCALDLGFDNIYLVLNEFIKYIESVMDVNHLVPLEELRFEVHITDHCNLNCKGCYHFSPLSEDVFLTIEEYETDIKQLAKLCDGKASSISILGGEPLLHEQIIDFFQISRSYFKDCRIKLLTNGILLEHMGENFWEACVEYNISIFCTKYPVLVDYNYIEKKASEYQLNIFYHNDIGVGEKTLIKYPFDLSGSQPIQWNYEHCTRSNRCLTLKHGKLFTCPMAAHAHIAKSYFNLDIELSELDSIDIYHVKNYEEIAVFFTKPIPFCKYCNLKIRPEQLEWAVSKKNKCEWF